MMCTVPNPRDLLLAFKEAHYLRVEVWDKQVVSTDVFLGSGANAVTSLALYLLFLYSC